MTTTQLYKRTIDYKDEVSQAVNNHRIVVDIYCRVSTDEQEDNTSLDEQERAGREYCALHGLIVGIVHREKYSGYYYREREKLSLVRERYLSRKIQGVVVRTYDRLSRKEVHFGILLEEMEHNTIQLYCVKEQLEDTLMGRMTRMFLGFMAEWEREKIMDRTITGKINRAKEGNVSVSGYKLLYWLEWHDAEKKDYPILNPERTKLIQEIAQKYADGVSCGQIVSELEQKKVPSPLELLVKSGRKPRGKDTGEWSVKTIMKWLKDPRITGKDVILFQNHTKGAKNHLEEVPVPDGTYPRVISDELYKKILERTTTNKEEASRRGKNPEQFLLRAGFIKCHCGSAMSGIERGGKRNNPTVYSCCRSTCSHMTNSKKADDFTWVWVEKLAEHTEIIEKAVKLATNDQRIAQETKSINVSLEKWRTKAANYLGDLDDTTLRGDSRAAIREKLNDANQRVEQLETEQAQIMLGMIDKEREKAAYQEILAWCKKVNEAKQPKETLQEKPKELDYRQKRDFLRLLGLVVIAEKPVEHGIPIYHIKIKLPEIQALILNTDLVRTSSLTGGR